MSWLSDPSHQLIAAGGGIVLLLLLWAVLSRWRRHHPPRGRAVDRKTAAPIAAGDFKSIALAQERKGNLEAALDYYIRAQELERAAQVARRLERPKQAAELYEKVGQHQLAAAMYRLAGLTRKADEITEQLQAKNEHLSEGNAAELSYGESPLLSPLERANQAEQGFFDLEERALQGDPEAQVRLGDLGHEAAEALLAADEVERAAMVCSRAGLVDQAINLYVNLLGDPGSAAALLARRGDHHRAAELYEAAGLKERALAAWVDWSEQADDPLVYLDRVDRLGPEAVPRLLEEIRLQRPLSRNTLDLHYRIAAAYEKHEHARPALLVLEQINALEPGFKDVPQKLGRLKVQTAPAIEKEATTPPDGASELTPFEPTTSSLGRSRERSQQMNTQPGKQAEPLPSPPAPQLVSADQELEKLSREHLRNLLGTPALEHLVNEVAAAAAREALARTGRQAGPQLVSVEADADTVMPEPSSIRRAREARTRGVETVEVNLKYAYDVNVQVAKQGPSMETLLALIGDNEPSLQNIEVYYRIGLAQAATGQWLEAQAAFETVEEISPGYRDAAHRAEEIARWQKAVTPVARPGERLGDELSRRYTLLGEIGRGGMAVVYRARDEALGREVALKFISDEVTHNPSLLDLFQREARAAAQLNHPNIVTIYDVGTLRGKAFISMELVDGTTVEKLLERQGKLPVLEVLRIAQDILGALDYAHSKHIIHRDIKPSNMMRNTLGTTKLMDFGLAKSIEGPDKTTMIAGTPCYMAPEQFTGRNIDASTDLFAFGASLYEMLAGTPPFEGVRRDRPPMALSQLNPAVPSLLEKLIHLALELDKSQRIHTAQELLRPIQQALASVKSEMARRGAEETQPEPAPRLMQSVQEPSDQPGGRSGPVGPSGTILKPFRPRES